MVTYLHGDAIATDADLAVLVATSRYFAFGISTVSTRVDNDRCCGKKSTRRLITEMQL